MNPREIWEAAPIAVVGALFTGMANAALLGMAAVYASQVGMTVERTAVFVGAAAVGPCSCNTRSGWFLTLSVVAR